MAEAVPGPTSLVSSSMSPSTHSGFTRSSNTTPTLRSSRETNITKGLKQTEGLSSYRPRGAIRMPDFILSILNPRDQQETHLEVNCCYMNGGGATMFKHNLNRYHTDCEGLIKCPIRNPIVNKWVVPPPEFKHRNRDTFSFAS